MTSHAVAPCPWSDVSAAGLAHRQITTGLVRDRSCPPPSSSRVDLICGRRPPRPDSSEAVVDRKQPCLQLTSIKASQFGNRPCPQPSSTKAGLVDLCRWHPTVDRPQPPLRQTAVRHQPLPRPVLSAVGLLVRCMPQPGPALSVAGLILGRRRQRQTTTAGGLYFGRCPPRPAFLSPAALVMVPCGKQPVSFAVGIVHPCPWPAAFALVRGPSRRKRRSRGRVPWRRRGSCPPEGDIVGGGLLP